MIRNLTMILLSLFIFDNQSFSQDKKSGALMVKDLPDIPGREGMMLTVDYPPGASSPKHRHNAHVFVYCLEGTVIMQVESGEQKTLNPGDTFYENPDDIHIMSKNASDTDPAKILVFFIKREGMPVSTPLP